MGSDNFSMGHRQRLRERFLADEPLSHTDEALLELLLTYSIPQRDVQPLAKALLARFGTMSGVLVAERRALCEVAGIKEHTASLLKLIDWIRTHHPGAGEHPTPSLVVPLAESPLEVDDGIETAPPVQPLPLKHEPTRSSGKRRHRQGTGLFARAVLKESIDLLPHFPDTNSLEDIKSFLQKNLHQSAERTRDRFASYIIRHLLMADGADSALRLYAIKYAGRQELNDAVFYRFCKSEPVMYQIMDELFLPAIGFGQLSRQHLRQYLSERFGVTKSVADYSHAIIEALTASGLAKGDRTKILYGYREILLPSFAFIVHSEFPEPGMHDVSALEASPSVRSMLWRTDQVVPALYELRNHGFIPKVSEIDSVRQFTTKWDLDQVVQRLYNGETPN